MNNVVAFCALLAATVTAYNFEDPEFNTLLSNDLDELIDNYALFSHRSKREEDTVSEKGKCNHHHRWEVCCAEDLVNKVRADDQGFKKICFREIIGKEKPERSDPLSCENMRHRKNQFTCIIECVGKKMDLLDSEGNPKQEEFESFVKESFSSKPWLASLQDKVISTCLDDARNATANRDASDSSSCNPAGAKITHCLYREIQLNCPAEEIKDERSCARIQERIKQGRDFFQPPPPPPPGAKDESDD